MARSKEFVEGFKSALNLYSWVDNNKRLRVGLPGVLLTEVIEQIESELEPEMIKDIIETEDIRKVGRSRFKIKDNMDE